MGDYTNIYFMPEASSEWTPSTDFLRSLIQRIGAETIYIFSGSSQPEYWDSEEGEIAPDLFFESRVPIEPSLQRWQTERPLVTHMAFHSGPWSEQVTQHLWATVPEDVRGDCHPWSPNILIGPWSVCAYDALVTEAQGTFCLSLSGDGSPKNREQYHVAFQACPGVIEMLSWLHENTGITWETVLHVS